MRYLGSELLLSVWGDLCLLLLSGRLANELKRPWDLGHGLAPLHASAYEFKVEKGPERGPCRASRFSMTQQRSGSIGTQLGVCDWWAASSCRLKVFKRKSSISVPTPSANSVNVLMPSFRITVHEYGNDGKPPHPSAWSLPAVAVTYGRVPQIIISTHFPALSKTMENCLQLQHLFAGV